MVTIHRSAWGLPVLLCTAHLGTRGGQGPASNCCTSCCCCCCCCCWAGSWVTADNTMLMMQVGPARGCMIPLSGLAARVPVLLLLSLMLLTLFPAKHQGSRSVLLLTAEGCVGGWLTERRVRSWGSAKQNPLTLTIPYVSVTAKNMTSSATVRSSSCWSVSTRLPVLELTA